jgi:hypothetical protein
MADVTLAAWRRLLYNPHHLRITKTANKLFSPKKNIQNIFFLHLASISSLLLVVIRLSFTLSLFRISA